MLPLCGRWQKFYLRANGSVYREFENKSVIVTGAGLALNDS